MELEEFKNNLDKCFEMILIYFNISKALEEASRRWI